MSQISFWDAEHAGKRKKTRREVFLAKMAHFCTFAGTPQWCSSGRVTPNRRAER